MDNRIRILIADDHELYVDGIKGFFKSNQIYAVVGEAFNGEELVRKANELKPHIVLTDLRMPLLDGSKAVAKITKNDESVKCVILTNYENDISIIEALEAGAIGYITKNMPKTELFTALEQVSRGYPYYCTTTNTKMIRLLGRSQFNPHRNEKNKTFSDRERQIIHLICEEKTTEEIAEQLFMSRRTVENNKARIFKRMEVKTSVGMAIYAIKMGLYVLGE
ncbi:MAG: response regulator transcription factor [Chitinophagaceae bacterium]|nr:response regulator transcription factor [Chitinophagaceae bacterium]